MIVCPWKDILKYAPMLPGVEEAFEKVNALTDFTPATGHTSGDWVIIRDPDVGVSGRKHKVCETCETVLEAETFWAEQETTPTEPGDNIDHNTVAPGTEEGGFKITGGNIVVIVIVLVAAFLLWFVDMKRK